MFVVNVYSHSRLIHAGVPVEDEMRLGRDPVSDLVVAESSVSRRHLSLRLVKIGSREVVVLTDEGSRNGTYVNSQRVQERVVAPGDLVRFGCCRLEVLKVEGNVSEAGFASKDTVSCELNPFTEDPNAAGRLRALFSMALGLSDLEIPFMLEKAAEIVRTCVDFDQFCLLLQGSRDMIPCTSWDRNGPCGKDDIVLSRALLGSAVKLGQPFVSTNIREDGRLSDAVVESLGSTTSVACVPLTAEFRVLGILYCAIFDSRKTFSQEDVYFLSLVACYVAAGISHRRNLKNAHNASAQLEAILGSLREGVIVCDADFRILSANDAARAIFPRKSLVGLGFEEALEGFVHNFKTSSASRGRSFDLERPNSATGSSEMEAYHATISSTAGHDAQGWLHIICIRDVTRERRSQMMQIAFVNRLAHKLRTPLTVIGGANSLMAEELGGAARGGMSELISLAEQGCEQMAGLIERFVDFTTVEEQKSQLHSCPMPVPVKYLMDQTLVLARDSIQRSGLTVANEIESGDVQIVVVPETICQCFYQVVQNACKFAGAGATLRLRMLHQAENLVVQFVDDGPGIPPGEQEKVFDIFHQVDRHGTGEVPGVGLGLWWTREIVRIHGGDVRISSPVTADRRGTSVEILFPLRLVSAEDSEDDRKETRPINAGEYEEVVS